VADHSGHGAGDSATATDTLESAVRTLLAAGDVTAASTRAIEAYGPQILGYLLAMARSDADAHDAFSQFCEDLWRGLPGFRWQASLRTWAYTLARNAFFRQHRRAPARHGEHVDPSHAPEIHALAEQVRTATAQYLRTEVKSRFIRIRDQLDPDDRTLLILRVDQRMTWRDIAAVLDDAADEPTLRRSAVTLRKRFERLKDDLRERLAADRDP
jgi:RNA polymerase sigma-70 factor (ECF subfamily)